MIGYAIVCKGRSENRRLPQTTADHHRTHRRTLQDAKSNKKLIFEKNKNKPSCVITY